MSHTYLIDLYEFIDKRLLEAEGLREKATGEAEEMFQQGRAKALKGCRQFLVEHYNRKLPRRLQSRYPG